MTTKPCKKCGNSERYAGGQCRPCALERGKGRIETRTPEQLREKSKAYRAKNPDKAKQSIKNYRINNPEKIKARKAARYSLNAEAERAYAAAYRLKNPNYKKEYLAANPLASRVYKQNRRARERENGGKLSTGIAIKLFKLQKGRCACCGKHLGDKYQLDHIIPILLGGKNEDSNIQLLTSICNKQKHAKHPIDFMQSRGFLL